MRYNRYNRALDLLCAAVEYSAAGKTIKAAQAFAHAVKDPSITAAKKMVNAYNSAAFAKETSVKSAVTRRLTATNDLGVDADDAGEEFRIKPEENADREVQEADFSDDEDFDGDEDADMLASDMDDEDDFLMDDEKVESSTKTATKKVAKAKATSATKATAATTFARALHNLQMLESKSKK